MKTPEQIADEIEALTKEVGAMMLEGQQAYLVIVALSMGFANLMSYAALNKYGPEGGVKVIDECAERFRLAIREAFKVQCTGNGYEDPYQEKSHNELLAAQLLKEMEDE